jgi:pimeloyl-ACP methyl ester carboxylesterase
LRSSAHPAAERLTTALSSGAPESVRAAFAPHGTVVLGTGGPARTVEDTVDAVRAVHDRVAAWSIEEIRRQSTAEGYVQQHTNRFLLRDGSEVRSHSCLVVAVDAQDRIERVEEYFDPTPLGFLAEAPAAPAPRPTSAWTQGTLTSDTETIYYETVSPPDPVGTIVLCHGAGGHHGSWFQQVPELSRRHRVITWDQRGFGRSTNHRRLAAPSTAATDLGRLLEHLGVEDAHLVGQSLGGWAVLKHAIRHPGAASSLIFTSSVAGILPPAVRRSFESYLQAASANTAPARLAHAGALDAAFCRAEPELAWLYQQLGSAAPPAPAEAIPLMLTDINELHDVASVRTRTLFVVGELDPIFPPASVAEAAAHIKGSRVEVVPGAGHSPYYESPRTWNRIVSDFVEPHLSAVVE